MEKTKENNDNLLLVKSLIGLLQSSILRLKSEPLFSSIDFTGIESNESVPVRIYDCPHWYNWVENTIVSLLGVKVNLSEKINNRLCGDGVLSFKVLFPILENEGKKIRIEISTHIHLGKPVYKYLYTTDGFSFGQDLLDFYNLKRTIKAIFNNKPILRKNQATGFMQRLNTLSPNFNKKIEEW